MRFKATKYQEGQILVTDSQSGTVDGSEIRGSTHQLRLVVYSIIYRIFKIPGGAGFLPSTVSVNTMLFWCCSIQTIQRKELMFPVDGSEIQLTTTWDIHSPNLNGW